MLSRFSRLALALLGLGSFIIFASNARAASILQQDVSSSLLGDVFMDDAVTGGGDTTVHDNSNGGAGTSFSRFFDLDGDSTIAAPGVAGTVSILDFGFATSGTASANDATSVTIGFTYLGLDEAVGGGDDVFLGSESVFYTHGGAGEYYVAFDSPISGSIDGLGSRFSVNILPDDNNGSLQESIRFKNGPLAFETFNGAKLSASGSFIPTSGPPAEWITDGSGNWNTAANWDSNPAVPGVGGLSGGNALFGNTITIPATVTLDVNANLDTLLIDNTNSYTVSDGGGSLTLSGSAVVNTATGAHAINAVIAGSAGLTKSGTGTLSLGGTNTYTGTNSLLGGDLAVSADSGLGNAANSIDINGGDLRVEGTTFSTLARTVTMTGDGAIDVADVSNSLNVTGSVTGTGTLTKDGAGTLELSNAASFDGAINVANGTLVVDSATSLGTTTGMTTVGEFGAVMDVSGSVTIAEDIRLEARFDDTSSHLRSSAGNNTFTGQIDAGGGADDTVTLENAADGTTVTFNNTSVSTARLYDEFNEEVDFVFTGTGNFKIGNENTPDSGAIVGDNVDVVVRMTDPTDTVTIATASNTTDTTNATGLFWGGTTTVESGTLAILDSATNDGQGEIVSSTIDVKAGATFDTSAFSTYSLQVVDDPDATPFNGDEIGQRLSGAGTINTGAGTITAFEDAVVAPGDSAGTLNVTGNMTFNMTQANPNGGLDYELSNSTTVGSGVNDLLDVSGTLTLTADGAIGGSEFNLGVTLTDGQLATGTYTLMQGGTLSGTANSNDFNVTLLNTNGDTLNTRYTPSVFVNIGSSGNVQMTVAGAAQTRTWNGGSVATGDGTWDVNITSDWVEGDQRFFDADDVVFGTVAGGDGTNEVAMPANVSPNSVTFQGTDDYVLSGAGGIRGTTGIDINSGITVTLASSNNIFSGDVNLASGATLELGDGTTGGQNIVSAANNYSLASGATLVQNNLAGELHTTGVISGAGGIRNETGTFEIGSNNTYTGATTVNGGTVLLSNIDSSTPLGSPTTGTTINGGTVRVNGQVGTIDEGFTLNGGTFAVGGGSVAGVTLSSDVTIGAGGGVLDTDGETGADGLAISGNIVGSSGGTLRMATGSNATISVAGNISNNGTLIKEQNGTLKLAGATSSISAPTIDIQFGDVDVTDVTAGLALNGQVLTGAGAVTGNVSTAGSSTIRVGGVAAGTPSVTTGLLLNYDAALDPSGDGSWEGGTVDTNFDNGNASTVAVNDPTFKALTAAYDMSTAGGALSPGSENAFFDFRGTSAGTFEVVFNVSNTAAGNEQVLMDIGGGRGVSLVLNGNVLSAGVNGDATNTTGFSTGALSTGWHHAVVVIGDTDPVNGSDDSFTFYLNDSVVGTTSTADIDDWSGSNSWSFGGVAASGTGVVVLDPTQTAAGAATLASPADYHGQIAIARYYQAELMAGDVSTNFAALQSDPFVDVETFNIIGDLTLDATSTVELDIFDTTLGNDVLSLTGALTAAGTLDVRLVNSVSLGDTFDILDFGSATGSFGTLNLPSLGGGLGWDVSNLFTTGVIEVINALVPGDFDGDGFVGLSDLNILGSNFGTMGGATLATGDANGDGNVTLADLNILGSNWNPAPAVAVPEPSTLTFVLIGLCGLVSRRR